ncbi:MAG: TetR/AcrR family transcriptional regulator [Sphingomonadaceae bacterium]|nr:TetR/AcrR family transcriptional regulator [Sphingomonadaceae bacterium]
MKQGRLSDEPAVAAEQPLDFAIAQACESVSHNLNGQRLGKKGRLTRERIIRAAIDLLEGEESALFTLSAVARKASLGMSSLYNYFDDLSVLMVAVLEPVMATAHATYTEVISEYWPDDELQEKCAAFWRAYYEFWAKHAALLHQRNRMSDAGDERMLLHRFHAVHPVIGLVDLQLGLNDGSEPGKHRRAMSAILMTAMERTMTIQTHPNYRRVKNYPRIADPADLIGPGARLLELSIRDCRQSLRAGGAEGAPP